LIRVAFLVVLTLAACPRLAGADEPNAFCDSIEEYILRVDDIAQNTDDPRLRKTQYEESLKKLLKAARAYFGPSCPCDRIMEAAKAQASVAEMYRKPAPGWEPGPTTENLLLFTRISRHVVRTQMKLTHWCWVKKK